MVHINIVIAILLLPIAFADDVDLTPIPTKNFSTVLDPTEEPNFLAFFKETEEYFSLTISTGYETSQYKDIIRSTNYLHCPTDKTKQWNIITIADKKIKYFKGEHDFNTAGPKYKQTVNISSDLEMRWKACNTITKCALPLPGKSDSPRATGSGHSGPENNPNKGMLSNILGGLCLMLTVVAMILVIYMIREKKTRPKAAGIEYPGQQWKEANASKNHLSQHHMAGSDDRKENVYEDIDEFGIHTQGSTRPKSEHECVNSLYGATV